MIVPMIHRWLQRHDLALLLTEIAAHHPGYARRAERTLAAGNVDAVLDSEEALEAVLGRGGTPAALPMTLLWYVPIRATLRGDGVESIDIADFTATLPVTFVSSRAVRQVAVREPGITEWHQAIESLPRNTVVQAERAAYCAGLALWWAGCFPERIAVRYGEGSLRAFGDFASASLHLAANILTSIAPSRASLYEAAGQHTDQLALALRHVRRDYLGRNAHTSEGRLDRFLSRIQPLDQAS